MIAPKKRVLESERMRSSENNTCAGNRKRKLESPPLSSVSVIIALYNASLYLVECLDSILAQTYVGAIEVRK
jgi:cellulose synthase/poly-beta-1,6-N-acetylglucosamine synthase-like glycosyltransferase